MTGAEWALGADARLSYEDPGILQPLENEDIDAAVRRISLLYPELTDAHLSLFQGYLRSALPLTANMSTCRDCVT